MRTILLIATGGTIASRPTAAGGLAPAITSQELLSCVPELAEFCRIDAIQLYNLDSTNMGPEQWQGIAAAVQENYDRYDGFVITHGTDTMGYTAAALSYMIRKSPKPVVLTARNRFITAIPMPATICGAPWPMPATRMPGVCRSCLTIR